MYVFICLFIHAFFYFDIYLFSTFIKFRYLFPHKWYVYMYFVYSSLLGPQTGSHEISKSTLIYLFIYIFIIYFIWWYFLFSVFCTRIWIQSNCIMRHLSFCSPQLSKPPSTNHIFALTEDDDCLTSPSPPPPQLFNLLTIVCYITIHGTRNFTAAHTLPEEREAWVRLHFAYLATSPSGKPPL